MEFDQLIDRPNAQTLQSVVAGRRLKLIAPFARRGALDKILPASHDLVQLIVRLPSVVNNSVVRLDNDPRDLIRLIERMGPRVRIYGLAAVHTKLYLNGTRAFYGSSNFTLTGFGQKPESLLVTTHEATYDAFDHMFTQYLGESVRATLPFLRRLRTRLEAGQLTYTASPEQPQTLKANPYGNDVAHFRNWLATVNDADSSYIEARFDPGAGYNMSGHVQSAFPGIRQFLRDNLDLIPALAGDIYVQHIFWARNPETVRRFHDFVSHEGHRFPANGGGAWANKLPPFLGGPGPNGGGRGSGLIARMLVYLAKYAIHSGF